MFTTLPRAASHQPPPEKFGAVASQIYDSAPELPHASRKDGAARLTVVHIAHH